MTRFADNLRVLMARQKVSQFKLASELGVTQAQISNYLTRKAYPRQRTLNKIALYFGVSVDTLECDKM
jgi:transcriptional regulator with XRE-family HTH domain